MSKTSRRWLQEHHNDPYVQKSKEDGYRSRATYKLLEIQEKDKLFKPGMTVLDLGAAPGGWSQIAAQMVGDKGRVIATDILPMDTLDGVTFLQGDFREEGVFEQLLEIIEKDPIDVVISDMAPNFSGNRSVDQPRSVYLMELALEMAVETLKPGGTFLVKIFEGEGIDAYRQQVKQHFKSVATRKPDASRGRSRETYILAKQFIQRRG
ncbi:MAG: 23S rRNA (uridine(2552)-2'-O)-methyltransferase RlmE [Pseudomonadota bacterium]|nr:23S rRNA (uridine(2552)-2'-O)-methyltransferase RlmE [Pseudomonadota bacterium]